MKKIILLFALLMSSIPSFAKYHQNLFIVKNVTPEQLISNLTNNLNNTITVDRSKNIIYSYQEQYYLKLYPYKNHTELFLYSDNIKDNELITLIQNLKFNIYKLEDNATIKNYMSDYKKYANEQDIYWGNKNKNDDNKQYKNYNPYSKNINNKIIEKMYINNNNIKIQRIQYQPKYKVKKKANAYEYIIINNTGYDIILNKVASQDFIGLTQIATYTVIPSWQDFIPIWGLIYGIQTDIEKNKFTRPHPINETIKAGDTMRILALSKKTDDAVADFTFTISNKKVKIILDPRKAIKL